MPVMGNFATPRATGSTMMSPTPSPNLVAKLSETSTPSRASDARMACAAERGVTIGRSPCAMATSVSPLPTKMMASPYVTSRPRTRSNAATNGTLARSSLIAFGNTATCAFDSPFAGRSQRSELTV